MDERDDARALDDDVRAQPEVRHRPGVVDRAELLDQRRFRTGSDPVEHVDIESLLHADQRGQ